MAKPQATTGNLLRVCTACTAVQVSFKWEFEDDGFELNSEVLAATLAGIVA